MPSTQSPPPAPSRPRPQASIEAMAQLLFQSRHPLFVVDAIDLAGAAACVRLARAVQGVLATSRPLDLQLAQDKGMLGTTVEDARLSADVVLVAGELSVVDGALSLTKPDASRRVIDLSTALGKRRPLLEVLARLRAALVNRPTGETPRDRASAVPLVATLKAARYGVALYSAHGLSALELEMLSGLVEDLAITTRFSLLQVQKPQGQSELLRMSLSLTGLPPPLSFRDPARPRHDPWAFDAQGMMERGACDLAVFISARAALAPVWLSKAPRWISLSAHPQEPANAAVAVEVGEPGVDHAGLVAPPELDGFQALEPTRPSSRPPLVRVLAQIQSAFEDRTPKLKAASS